MTAAPLPSPAQFSVGVGFTIGTPPPALPVYTMPPAPYPNWQWTPGYWAWGPAGYYWVPGTWVAPPAVGLYWTPGYWGYNNGYYGWNGGYWGATVGFYGGINYGFGYYGSGFYGGTWNGGTFAYNTAVVNVNRTVIHNTYINKTVINRGVVSSSRVAYNGGHGGVSARPTSAQIDARRDGRAPTTAQVSQAKVAGQDRALYANVNKGKPPVTAVAKPISDPKQLPKYAPVTASDKQAAQTQMKGANKAPTTMAKPENKAPAKAPATTQHHAAPVSQPQNKKPPSSGNMMHTQGTMHNQGTMHTQGAMHPHPSGQGHPPSGAMHSQGRPPQGQGKPPGGQGKPPQGQGQNKNKPPRG